MRLSEGTRREHVYLDGAYWDVHVLAISRDRWNTPGLPFLQRLRPT
ncbi:MAG: hypothetical protein ACR2HQ_11690 [Ilumatobacteraceae bacterium]